jgi:molecular chaperone DnaK
VRERLRELAAADLGQVREEWLTWADQNFDLRLERPRAVVTIPAYFRNNQKHATRTACKIAGIDLVRLIHEPTAACIEAARQRHLTGTILVVDLGAGTLDFSLLDVSDGLYEAKAVGGDASFGSRDFDEAIVGALKTQLTDQGVTISPTGGSAQRRLEVAAEKLKIDLSSQAQAQYVMRGLAGGTDVTVELDRAQLAVILTELLGKLRETCAAFKEAELGKPARAPERMVLIGGPMLSPMVREAVEEAFGLKATLVRDPRLAVACGAAIQAAVLDGKCRNFLLMDITPLSLGVRTKTGYAELVAAHTPIPVRKSDTFTTTQDSQSEVQIEIFNGSLDGEAKIGARRRPSRSPSTHWATC